MVLCMDARPAQMPHKPFPTTSSFRVTNGFEVSASSTSQHTLGPAPPSTPPHPLHHANGVCVQGFTPPRAHAASPLGDTRLPADDPNGSRTGGSGAAAAPGAAGGRAAHGRSSSSSSSLSKVMDPTSAAALMVLPPLKVTRDPTRPPLHPSSSTASAARPALEALPPASLPAGSGRLAGKLHEGEHAAKGKAAGTPFSTPTPSSADHLGWQGLLEFSRSSGAAGVLGPGTIAAVDAERHRHSVAEIEICCTAHTSTRVRHLVKSVIRGLKACQEPERPREGMGGTYFFMNENGRKVGILKPCDEEPLAPNNPKGYVGRQLGDPGWKPTVRVGEAAMREVAAYLLDHDGWAKVPTSVLVRARHPIFCYNNRMSSVRASSVDLAAKDAGADGSEEGNSRGEPAPPPLPMKLGSLQEFVRHECDTSEMGTSRFSTSDVHRIGILDIRLFNTDRHAGNMLVRMPRDQSCANLKSRIADAQYELIPIDHGFCLPETLEAPYFEWLHWPQAMLPFSEEELAYIQRIDIEADKELLRKELPNLRPECLRVLEISTMLLKHCAEAGLTLFEIASIMTRPFEAAGEELSDLEKFASYARNVIETLSESDAEEGGDDCGIEEEGDSGSGSDDEAEAQDGVKEEGWDVAGGLVQVEKEGVDGLPLSAILGSVDEYGPYYGASSPEALDEDVFGFRSSGALGNQHSGAVQQAPGYGNSGGAGTGKGVGASRSPTDSSSLSSADRMSSMGSAGARGKPQLAAGLGSTLEGATPPPHLSSSGRRSSSFGHRTRRRSGGLSMSAAAPIPASSPSPSPFSAVPSAFPSSVHITDGFLWRRLKGRQASHAKRRHNTSASTYKRPGARHLLSPQAYPPPVVALAPDSLTGLFSGMDDSQWARFVGLMRQQVDAALRAQKWRQDKHKDSAVTPMSCPRF